MYDPHKPQKVLLRICDQNNYSKPVYKLIRKFDISEHHTNTQGHVHRDFYMFQLQVGNHIFVGQSLSKRMAKNFAAYEAIKLLRFKRSKRNIDTELVELCKDHRLKPFYEQTLKGGVYSYLVEVRFQLDNKYVHLEGTATSASPIDAKSKTAAAKSLLDQLMVIFEYASYEAKGKK